MKTVEDLRTQLQLPMRPYNDIGGALYGDWISIYLTWVFLRLGLGPTIATVGMLLFGLAGAGLVAFGGVAAVVGAVFLTIFYILDCVDGEVARHNDCEKYIWTFHDFFFGVYVMTGFYLGTGIHAGIASNSPWLMLFGVAATLGYVFKKLLIQAPYFLTAHHLFLRTAAERDRILRELALAAPQDGSGATSVRPVLSRRDVVRKYGGILGIARGILTNFHLSVLIFFVLAVADLCVGPWSVRDLRVDLKTAFIIFYGVLLPADFADYMASAIRGRRFLITSHRLLQAIRKVSRSTEWDR